MSPEGESLPTKHESFSRSLQIRFEFSDYKSVACSSHVTFADLSRLRISALLKHAQFVLIPSSLKFRTDFLKHFTGTEQSSTCHDALPGHDRVIRVRRELIRWSQQRHHEHFLHEWRERKNG